MLGDDEHVAVLLVDPTNFTDPEVIVMILVGNVVGLGFLFLAAGFFGKRVEAVAAVAN